MKFCIISLLYIYKFSKLQLKVQSRALAICVYFWLHSCALPKVEVWEVEIYHLKV